MYDQRYATDFKERVELGESNYVYIHIDVYILLFSLLLIRTFECQITSSITLTYLIYYFTDLAKTIYRYNNRDILPLLCLPCQLSMWVETAWSARRRPVTFGRALNSFHTISKRESNPRS